MLSAVRLLAVSKKVKARQRGSTSAPLSLCTLPELLVYAPARPRSLRRNSQSTVRDHRPSAQAIRLTADVNPGSCARSVQPQVQPSPARQEAATYEA